GQTLASAGGGEGYPGEVKLWDVVTGRERANLWAHEQPVYALAFAADGKMLATGGTGSTVRLWDVATGQLRTTWQEPRKVVYALALAPDGHPLTAGGVCEEARVMFLDRVGGHVPAPLRACYPLAFAPDGQTLATGNLDGPGVQLWDFAQSRERK